MRFELKAPTWRRAQWTARAPRLALLTCCAVLSAVGLRGVLSPPTAAVSAPAAHEAEPRNADAAAVAEAFARAYLTWDERRPEVRVARLRALAPQLASELEADTATRARGRQSVSWSAVSGEESIGDERRITVLAETTRGLTSLAVSVERVSDGGLAIVDFPAVVGVPPMAKEALPPEGEPVSDQDVEQMVTRAVRSYLGRRGGALSADLLPGAVVVVPSEPLRLVGVDEMTWSQPGREVRVVLRAEVGDVELPLTYAIGVVRQAGRWFVRWIGTQQASGGRS